MTSTADFLTYTQWMGIATIVFAVLTGLGFLWQWGIRFRLVGATGFMAVLVVGLFALSIVPFRHRIVPGAAKFSLVYDNGGNQVVIAVAPTITETELTATLQQAAGDFFSYGRLGGASSKLLVRARTIIHPEPGVSQPLYLGEIERSAANRSDPTGGLKIDRTNWHLLQQAIIDDRDRQDKVATS